MQHLLQRTRARISQSAPWIPVLALLSVVAILVAQVPSPGAQAAGPRLDVGGPAASSGLAASLPGSWAAASGPVAPVSRTPDESSGLGINQVYSHTVHLPLILRSYPGQPESILGVQIYDTNESLTAKMVDVGAQWARLRFSWDDIEPVDLEPHEYHWSAGFESDLAGLAGGGVRVILNLMDNPDWAATNRGGPVDLVPIGELVEFMEAVVARYGAPPYNVKYWEFYNEPDNGVAKLGEDGYVGYFGHQPEAYVALLEAVYGPIKAVDPEAQITFGGIAYDNFDDPGGGPFVKTFLDGVLANGGGDYFDVMNFHFYPAFAWYWEDQVPGSIDILAKYTYLWDKLDSYGVHKPFICTETSKWSDEDVGGSDEIQSRYVVQSFVRSMAADFRFTIWWALVDVGPGTDMVGLLDRSLQPKPAYWAYQTLAQQLGGAEFVRAWTEAETGAPVMEVEVYEFGPGEGLIWPAGTVRVVSAWTNDEATRTLVVPVAALVQVDKYGVETAVYDGDDGLVDGLIHLVIGPSPVYLHLPE